MMTALVVGMVAAWAAVLVEAVGAATAAALPGTFEAVPGTPAGFVPPASSSECCSDRGAVALGSKISEVSSLVLRS